MSQEKYSWINLKEELWYTLRVSNILYKGRQMWPALSSLNVRYGMNRCLHIRTQVTLLTTSESLRTVQVFSETTKKFI